jgi:hypothetical protein
MSKMKIKIVLFVVLFMVFHLTALGQVSKESYEKAVDYLNCKAVGVSLKGNKTQDDFIEYSQKYSCEKDFPLNSVSTFLKKIPKTRDLFNEIDSLKSQLKPEWKPEEATTFLSEQVFSDQDKYPKLFDFAGKRKDDPDFATLQADLKEKLPTLLSAKTSAENPNITNDQNKPQKPSPTRTPTSTPEPKDEGWISSTISPVSFLLSAIALILTSFLLYMYLRVAGRLKLLEDGRDILKRRIKTLEEQKSPAGTQPSPGVRPEVRQLEQRVKEEIKKLNERLDSLPGGIGSRGAAPRTFDFGEQESPLEREPRREFFYLSFPNEDGTFNASSASTAYRDGASIYKFTKISPEQAEFAIDEDERSIKLALGFPNKSIDPVCDAQNAYDSNAERIFTEEPGRAELLNGEKWRVTQKAKIRYER